MIITEWEQGTEEWLQERLGTPSASNFGKIVNQNGTRSKQRESYMYELAGEIITGEKKDNYKNHYMDKGNEREDESRQYYEITRGVDVVQVGFCYMDEDKLFGCSPDGLVGEVGGFETKNAEPHIQAKRLHKGWTGTEYHRQVMGCLLVTGRDWWDLVSYSRGMKQVVIRFERDYLFLEILEKEVHEFCHDLQRLVEEIR